MKQCIRCGRWRSYRFHFSPNYLSVDGKKDMCNDCVQVAKRLAKAEKEGRCFVCGTQYEAV